IPMRGRMMHAPDGTLTFQPYSKNQRDAILSVSRGALNQALLSAAEACPGVTVHFDQRCDAVDLATGVATLTHSASGATRTSIGRVLVGADGAFSAVRAAMQKQERFDYAQHYLAHGYKELSMPARADGDFAM